METLEEQEDKKKICGLCSLYMISGLRRVPEFSFCGEMEEKEKNQGKHERWNHVLVLLEAC